MTFYIPIVVHPTLIYYLCGVAWFQDFELFYRANSNSTVLKSVYLDIKLGAAFSRILNNFVGKMFTENENYKTINEKIIMKIQK